MSDTHTKTNEDCPAMGEVHDFFSDTQIPCESCGAKESERSKMANSDVDLRLQAARELTQMLGDLANLIGRVRGVLDRLVDEIETLADDPQPNSESNSADDTPK